MLTIRSLFLGLNFWSMKIGTIAQENRKAGKNLRFLLLPAFLLSLDIFLVQSMLTELFITFLRLLVNFSEMVRNISFSRLVRLERCRSCHVLVPMLCPDPVGLS